MFDLTSFRVESSRLWVCATVTSKSALAALPDMQIVNSGSA
ncbi:MAG: hypothetical protein WCC43_08070 [Pseudolabrys sp.]